MADSLIVRDGQHNLKELQVDVINGKFVQNHSIISTVTGSNVTLFYSGSSPGWNFDESGVDTSLQVVTVANADTDRKGIIIHNNSEYGKCYLLFCGSSDSFGTITDGSLAPPKYSVFLDSGATYFGDYATAALKHMIYVTNNYNGDQTYMTVAVTEVF